MLKSIIIALMFLFPMAVANEWRVIAIRITEPIKIDGKLDEPAWSKAQPAINFRQYRPELGKPATNPTEVRILYDNENIYFGWILKVSDTSKLVAIAKNRDEDNSYDDALDILFDTLNNKNTSYDLMLNVANVQYDGKIWDNGMNAGGQWDGIWNSAVTIGEDGWVAEIAIPWSTIVYDDRTTSFGLNLFRMEQGLSEGDVWAGNLSNLNKVSDFGTVDGFSKLPKPKAWSFTPYGKVRAQEELIPADEWDISPDAGLDALWRPNSTNTINATYNPDYAHIEADLEQINLTPDELYLPEKRPFFLEAAESYNTDFNLWYTRRMTDIEGGGKVYGSSGMISYGGTGVQLKEDDPNYPSSFFGAFNTVLDVPGRLNAKLVGATREYNLGYSRAAILQNHLYIADCWDLMSSIGGSQNHHPFMLDPMMTEDKRDGAGSLFLSRSLALGFLGAGVFFVGKDWQTDTAYETLSDIDSLTYIGVLQYPWQVNQGFLQTVGFGGEFAHARWTDGSFKYDSYSPGLSIKLQEHNTLDYELEAGTNTSYYDLTGEVYHQMFQTLEFGHVVETWWGAGVAYGWGEYYGERVQQPQAEVIILPLKSVKLTADFDYVIHKTPDALGTPQPDTWASNQSIVWAPLQQFFVRLTGRENTQDNRFFYGALLGWTYNPGSTAYIAFNENRDYPQLEVTERTVFIKAGYMLMF
jgi:hypothetical protein